MTDLSVAPGLMLVFGASGYIGTNLVKRLRQLDRPVRASARNRAVRKHGLGHSVSVHDRALFNLERDSGK
jgi:uncharacterized protein YbjT (DUF2867 family)